MSAISLRRADHRDLATILRFQQGVVDVNTR
jgi:hypothetical protein